MECSVLPGLSSFVTDDNGDRPSDCVILCLISAKVVRKNEFKALCQKIKFLFKQFAVIIAHL